MKEKYTYLDENGKMGSPAKDIAWAYLIFFVSLVVGLLTGSVAVIAVMCPILLPVYFILMKCKACYTADEDSVEVSRFWKTTRVEYKDIQDIQYETFKGSRKVPNRCITYYGERLIIKTEGKEYTFCAKIDADTATPRRLQQELDNAKLARLKRYIERQIYISQ